MDRPDHLDATAARCVGPLDVVLPLSYAPPRIAAERPEAEVAQYPRPMGIDRSRRPFELALQFRVRGPASTTCLASSMGVQGARDLAAFAASQHRSVEIVGAAGIVSAIVLFELSP
jgi:hypothetical protein